MFTAIFVELFKGWRLADGFLNTYGLPENALKEKQITKAFSCCDDALNTASFHSTRHLIVPISTSHSTSLNHYPKNRKSGFFQYPIFHLDMFFSIKHVKNAASVAVFERTIVDGGLPQTS